MGSHAYFLMYWNETAARVSTYEKGKYMNFKSTVFLCFLFISSKAYCKDISPAYFQVIQMRTQTEACSQKFPSVDLSVPFERWRSRNSVADEEVQKDGNFSSRKAEMIKNLINSKRFTEQSCVDLKKYLLSNESDAK